MRLAASKTLYFRRLATAALALALASGLPAGNAAAEEAPDAESPAARWEARARERLAAVKAEPRNAERMADFGETLLTAGQLPSARKALERAKDAGSPRAELLLAECGLRAPGTTRAAARDALALASSAGGDDPQAALLESMAKEQLGDVEGALDAAVFAAELAERTPGIGEELAHRILDQLERCIHWNHVFSLVE